MAANVYEYYKGLPGWAKGAIIVGGGLVLYLIGDSIWGAVKQAKQNAANLKTASDAVDFLNSLAAQGVTPSVPDAQFQSWSNSLVVALSGCSTDHAALETIFNNLNNTADVYKLIAVFGSQSISGCTVLWIPWTSGMTLSLPGAISQYVSADEKAVLNGILASKQTIQYRFS